MRGGRPDNYLNKPPWTLKGSAYRQSAEDFPIEASKLINFNSGIAGMPADDFIPLSNELPDYRTIDQINRRHRREAMSKANHRPDHRQAGRCKAGSQQLNKRKPISNMVEIDVSDDEGIHIPVPYADRSEYSKPDANDELTTTESSIRRLYSVRKGDTPLSAREYKKQLMAAKEKFMDTAEIVEIDESDDDRQMRKEKEIERLKQKIRDAEAERERLARLHSEAERQKEIEKEKLARLEKEKTEVPKKHIQDNDYPEDNYLKQLSGAYKLTHGKSGNRLTQLIEKEPQPQLQQQKMSFTSRFQVLDNLGEGSSCVVRKVLSKKNQKIYAVKSCKSNDHTSISYIKKEFKILKMLTHPNIIKTCGIFESNSNVHFL